MGLRSCLYRDCRVYIGLYRGYIGGFIGIMKKKMETII